MKRAAPFLLVLAVVLVYANSWAAPFTYDDKIEVVGNPAIRDLGNPLAIVLANPARVLVLATYALNWAMGGFDPRGYHAFSIALHALNATLALGLARRVVSPTRALLAASIWALHPLATEGVSYITGRSDALVATWFFAATILWIDDSRTADLRKRLGAFACAALALVTKETAVVLPLVLLAADVFLVAGGRWKLVEPKRYAPLLVLLLGAGGARLAIAGWPVPEVPRPLDVHVVAQGEAWARYLQLWLVPWGQSILQAMPATMSVVGAVALLAFFGAAVLAVRKGGVPAFSAAVWALPLLVTSAFVLKETMAEHRAYFAGFGLCLFVASRLPERRWVFMIPLVLGALTVRRNLAWADEPTLWGGAAARWPGSADAAYGYGKSLREARRYPEAVEGLKRVLELDPTRIEALDELGIAYAEQHQFDDARHAWEEALKVAPGHCAALNDLAALQLTQGDKDGAMRGFEGTLRACPDDPLAHFHLGELLTGAHQEERAIPHLQAYLAADPTGAYRPDAEALLRKMGAPTTAVGGP